jgi:hypothetical protein
MPGVLSARVASLATADRLRPIRKDWLIRKDYSQWPREKYGYDEKYRKTNSLAFLFEPVTAALAVVELARLLPGIASCLLTVRAFLSQAVSHCVDDYFRPDGIHFDSPFRLGALRS